LSRHKEIDRSDRYNLIIVTKWSDCRSYELFATIRLLKARLKLYGVRYYLRKPMARSIDPVLFFLFFFKQAILSRRCPLFPISSSPFPFSFLYLSSVPVQSSLVIFNYRIFNRELLRLSRHGSLLFRESFASDRRVVRRQFIYINSEIYLKKINLFFYSYYTYFMILLSIWRRQISEIDFIFDCLDVTQHIFQGLWLDLFLLVL